MGAAMCRNGWVQMPGAGLWVETTAERCLFSASKLPCRHTIMQSRKTLVINTVVGLVLSLAVTYGVFRVLGPAAAMLTLIVPLIVLRPLALRVLAAGWRGARSHALASVQENFYAYQGVQVGVVEDMDHCRWVSTDAIRKITGSSVSDPLFARLYPSAWQMFGKQAYLRVDALLAHLNAATGMNAIGFKVWVQRNIAKPAQTVRRRLGVPGGFGSDSKL